MVVVKTQNTRKSTARKSTTTIRCVACGLRFTPEPRAVGRQRFCSSAECRKASHKESQRRWVAKNPEYFSGSRNVERVQEWRKMQALRIGDTKQQIPSEPSHGKGTAACAVRPKSDQLGNVLAEIFRLDISKVLQDDWPAQLVILVGLIAWWRSLPHKQMEPDSSRSLQEIIAFDLREIMFQGHAILRQL